MLSKHFEGILLVFDSYTNDSSIAYKTHEQKIASGVLKKIISNPFEIVRGPIEIYSL